MSVVTVAFAAVDHLELALVSTIASSGPHPSSVTTCQVPETEPPLELTFKDVISIVS